jgi:hypothetical protein
MPAGYWKRNCRKKMSLKYKPDTGREIVVRR